MEFVGELFFVFGSNRRDRHWFVVDQPDPTLGARPGTCDVLAGALETKLGSAIEFDGAYLVADSRFVIGTVGGVPRVASGVAPSVRIRFGHVGSRQVEIIGVWVVIEVVVTSHNVSIAAISSAQKGGSIADRNSIQRASADPIRSKGTVRTMTETQNQIPDRNLALELVRVTEAAAMAASRWMGRGDKLGADGAAVDAMRLMLQSVNMEGLVVIGEGEKDEAPMLYNGEIVGNGSQPQTDVAVDPIDGTTLTALGREGAIAVIAVSPRGTMYDPGPCVYMEKIAAGPDCADVIDITKSPTENLEAIAERKREDVRDVTAVILDRDRHGDLIEEVREAGARIRLIADGDVAGAIATAWPDSGVDVLFGVGGTPEGVITAAALKSMGGGMQGKLWPRDKTETDAAIAGGWDLDEILTIDRLAGGEDCFFAATGITDGDLLRGVHYDGRGASTQSLVMRSRSGTVRLINAQHQTDKINTYASVDY